MPVLSHSSPLLLGSGSPRRRELLESIGLPLLVAAFPADETARPGELPEAYLQRVAAAKLEATRAGASSQSIAHACLLVADTIVVNNGQILSKPVDRADAARMVAALAGATHEVKTRFCVALAAGGPMLARTITTRVFVRELTASWIDAYVGSGEGDDKAGSYAVQGRFACAVRKIEGSYSNVVGLPLCEVVEDLEALGLLSGFSWFVR